MAKMESKVESMCSCVSIDLDNLLSKCSSSLESLISKCDGLSEGIVTSNEKISDSVNDAGSGIEQSILELSIKLNESLNGFSMQITETIIESNDKLSVTAIVFAVFVAFLGALSAYLFNYLHWRLVRKTNKSYGVGNDLISLIDSLEKEALKYWVGSYKSSKAEEITIVEINIKSVIRQIHAQTRMFDGLLNSKRLKQKVDEINNFPLEIFDLVTGGDFESRSRKSSKRKAMKIAKKCSDVKLNISSIIMKI